MTSEYMKPFVPLDLDAFKQFVFERVLGEDPLTHALALLGTFPVPGEENRRATSVLRIEKIGLSQEAVVNRISSTLLQDLRLLGQNDIYSWFSGWLNRGPDTPDLKINIISPATDVHVQKYSTQRISMVHETPELYEKLVKPFIQAFPPARTQWIEDIFEGKYESEAILFRHPSSTLGYLLLPDMKWDSSTVSTLYLVAIAASRNIRSLRDLRKHHLPMLRSIRRESIRIVGEKWGLEAGSLRFFIHYQPSYYHFHVHVVNSNYIGLMGMSIGQAHLLDDIISLLEIDTDTDTGPSILERMTFTYGLGERHGLFPSMKAAQVDLTIS